MATAGSNPAFAQPPRKPANPRMPTGQARYQQPILQMQYPHQMANVLMQNPAMMPPMYTPYQAGMMGSYLPNMAVPSVAAVPPQVITQPFVPPYRHAAPPNQHQQQPLTKRERRPLVIKDPTTNAAIDMTSVAPGPAAATAAVNPSVPAAEHLILPAPYVAPPANVPSPEQEQSTYVKEEFKMKVQEKLTGPQAAPTPYTATTTTTMTMEGKQHQTDTGGVNAQPDVHVEGTVAVPQQLNQPQPIPVVAGDQLPVVLGAPLSGVPDGGMPAGGEVVAMTVAEEFRVKVRNTLSSPSPQPRPTGTATPPGEAEGKGSHGVGSEVKPVSPAVGFKVEASPSPVAGSQGSVEQVVTPVNIAEPSGVEEVPKTGEEESGMVEEEVVVKDEVVKDEVVKDAVTVETEEGGEKDYVREEEEEVEEEEEEEEEDGSSEKEEGEIDDEEYMKEEEDLRKSSSPQRTVDGSRPVSEAKPVLAPLGWRLDQQDGTQRIRYDREFLLQFRDNEECRTMPPELLAKECALFKIDMHRGGARRSSRQGESRKVIAHSAPEKVELKKAEQPWQRQAGVQSEMTEAQKETLEVFRKFQSILNKLTPQKFDKLAAATLQLPINTEERLRGVIDKIFTKALEETNFSEVYANLCRVLATITVETVNAEGKAGAVTFRRLLLTKCQQEFEKDKQDDAEREVLQEKIKTAETEEIKKQREMELEAAEVASRHRSLGNIRFIGELYKLKILSESIMHECMIRLLKSTSDEESLECFAKLMMTTGKDLDKEEAKQRIDAYFNRVNDIIRKGKVSSRIKFALQDVVDLRENKWVPRRDTKVKTIDQIHREAEDEEQMTKQLASQYVGGGAPPYGRRDSRQSSVEDKRRGTKPGLGGGGGGGGGGEEWSRVGDKKPQQSAKADLDRIRSIKKPGDKEKESSGLRAASKWGSGSKGVGTSSAVPEASKSAEKQPLKAPARSSSGGTGGGGGGTNKRPDKAPVSVTPSKGSSGALPPRRSSTHPDEKAAILQTVKEMTGVVPPKRSSEPPAEQQSELDEETVTKKTGNIVQELCQNEDLKEAVECVKEMKSPTVLHVFVSSAVNRALEDSPESRQLVGQLFHKLLQDGTLAVDRMAAGLGEVMDSAEDIEIDVPKMWDYLGEILCYPVAHHSLPLGTLISTTFPPDLLSSGKAAQFVTNLLKQCLTLTSEEVVSQLWFGCREQHSCLQLRPEDLNQLEFLRGTEVAAKEPNSALIEGLAARLGSSNVTNDEILDWIENSFKEEYRSLPSFIRNLTIAIVQATVTGKGSSVIYGEDLFQKRLIILRKYVNSDKNLELEVLLGLQAATAKLEHPPKLLCQMFNAVYDHEVVTENTCYTWKDHDHGVEGKGPAVMSVNSFFTWLESADKESDPEGTSDARQP